MDQLPSIGTGPIFKIVGPTFNTFQPLLAANADNIRRTECRTYAYGAHDRQQLDVYQPSKPDDGQTASPIMIFLYGGGLVRGDKSMPHVPGGLLHANVGHFFTEQYGFTTIIPDYRLISHGAKFPSGGEDIALVVKWINEHLRPQHGAPRCLFMMGNSAGGIHLSTYLLAPEFAESRRSVSAEKSSASGSVEFRGAILLSVPFHFQQAVSGRSGDLKAYFGDHIAEHCPMGLLQSAVNARQAGDPFSGVKILVVTGELDPEDEILAPNRDFLQVWEDAGLDGSNEMLETLIIAGHNHISPILSLGTAKQDGEAWGHQVGEFCKKLE